MILSDATANPAIKKYRHPERSSSNTLRTTQSKDLRLLLPLLFLFLTATNTQGQHTTAAAPHFNGQTAYNLTAQLLQVAPKRFNGSPGHQLSRTSWSSHCEIVGISALNASRFLSSKLYFQLARNSASVSADFAFSSVTFSIQSDVLGYNRRQPP